MIPERGTATITEVRPFGFDTSDVISYDELPAHMWAKVPRYLVTYRHNGRLYSLYVTDNPRIGFTKVLATAVRKDVEARRYQHDSLEAVLPLLPLEVEL